MGARSRRGSPSPRDGFPSAGASTPRKPLVPADSHADRAEAGRPHSKSRVAGPEIELLLVPGAVGDVALPVDAEDRAVGVGDGDAVVVGLPGALEEGDRDDDA